MVLPRKKCVIFILYRLCVDTVPFGKIIFTTKVAPNPKVYSDVLYMFLSHFLQAVASPGLVCRPALTFGVWENWKSESSIIISKSSLHLIRSAIESLDPGLSIARLNSKTSHFLATLRFHFGP